MDQVIRKAG